MKDALRKGRCVTKQINHMTVREVWEINSNTVYIPFPPPYWEPNPRPYAF